MGNNQTKAQGPTTSTNRSAPAPPAQNPNFTPVAPSAPPSSSAPPPGFTPSILFKGLYSGSDSKPSSFQPTPTVSGDEVVEVNAIYARDYVLQGVTNQGHILVSIHTNQLASQEKRPPFELVIVLDISGSMSGAPLETAKKTIAHVVESLEDDDILHFVTYNGAAHTVFRDGRAKDREQLIKQVEAVSASGSTNMWAGLTSAAHLLETSTQTGGLRSVFLFSDGHANGGGVTTADQFKAKVPALCSQGGFTISTFGLGTGFDAAVMEGIAQVGEGYYCYIEAPSEIARKVGVGLEGLTKCIATDSTLFLSGLGGCVVKQIVGHGNDKLLKGIPLGALRANNTVDILLEVEITPPSNDTVKEDSQVDVLKWELQWTNDGEKQTLEGNCSSVITTDRKNLELERALVVTAVTLREVADRDREIELALKQQKLEEAERLQKLNCVQLSSERLVTDQKCEMMLQKQCEQLTAMEEKPKSSWNLAHMMKSTGHRAKVSEYASAANYCQL